MNSYAEKVHKEGPIEASKWLEENASLEELEIIGKHIQKEIDKYDFTTE